MQRIAPNNQLPATHFIEVWSNGEFQGQSYKPLDIDVISWHLNATKFRQNLYTVCLFRIRENELPTKHKFNK